MNRRALIPLSLSVALFVSTSVSLEAIAISIANPWTVGTVDQSDLDTPDTPGGRIPDPWTLSPDDDVSGVLLTITGAVGNWRVDVQQSDVLWDPDVVVRVRRRTVGTGAGTAPAGGTTYLTLDGTVQQFFTGNLDRSNIRVQFQLQMNEPLARILPIDAESYSTDTIFTVTDT